MALKRIDTTLLLGDRVQRPVLSVGGTVIAVQKQPDLVTVLWDDGYVATHVPTDLERIDTCLTKQ